MFDVESIWESEKKMIKATGLNLTEAIELSNDFTSRLKETQPSGNRGRPRKTDEKTHFLILMMYYRHYPTYDLMGLIFSIDPATIKRHTDDGEIILRDILSKKNFSHLLLTRTEMKLRESLRQEKSFI